MAARRLADKLIALAKQNSLSAKRRVFQILGDHRLVSQLFKEAVRFSHRVDGYTRILSTGQRRGDGAEMVIFALTEIKKKEPRLKKKKAAEALKAEAPEAISSVETLEKETPQPAEKPERKVALKEKEKPPIVKKPTKGFLGSIRNIFKKERDSL
jgi:large subunit ribosomal protein L17